MHILEEILAVISIDQFVRHITSEGERIYSLKRYKGAVMKPYTELQPPQGHGVIARYL